MRHVLGMALVGLGMALVWAAERRRRRALAAPAPEPLNPSLAVFGEIARPIILCALAYLGVKLSLVFLMMDAGRWFSLFDLGGLLFLLAAYGRWMVVWTRYRLAPEAPGAPLEGLTTAQAEPPTHLPDQADAPRPSSFGQQPDTRLPARSAAPGLSASTVALGRGAAGC